MGRLLSLLNPYFLCLWPVCFPEEDFWGFFFFFFLLFCFHFLSPDFPTCGIALLVCVRAGREPGVRRWHNLRSGAPAQISLWISLLVSLQKILVLSVSVKSTMWHILEDELTEGTSWLEEPFDWGGASCLGRGLPVLGWCALSPPSLLTTGTLRLRRHYLKFSHLQCRLQVTSSSTIFYTTSSSST